MRKTLIVLFFTLLLSASGYTQGIYLPKGESGAMLSFYYGEAKIGYINNTFIGYSFNGKITTGIAFQQATYAATKEDWDYFSIPLIYHMIKPLKEGDLTFDLLGSYSFGNFTDPNYDTGDWERIGHEVEIGLRIGTKLIDSERFITIPKLTAEYFWSFLKFDDKLYDYTIERNNQGSRLTGSFDILIGVDDDKSFLIAPFIRYNSENFIWGGEIGFLWGKLH